MISSRGRGLIALVGFGLMGCNTPPSTDSPATDAQAGDAQAGDVLAADRATDDVISEPPPSGPCTGECRDAVQPFVVGLEWEYRFTRSMIPGCTQNVTYRVISAREDGVSGTVYRFQASCGEYRLTDYRVTRSAILCGIAGGGLYRCMNLPPEDGAVWGAGSGSGVQYRWERVETVTVPAGTFTGCWRRHDVTNNGNEVYCPGVGQVSASYNRWSNYDMVLVRRNF